VTDRRRIAAEADPPIASTEQCHAPNWEFQGTSPARHRRTDWALDVNPRFDHFYRGNCPPHPCCAKVGASDTVCKRRPAQAPAAQVGAIKPLNFAWTKNISQKFKIFQENWKEPRVRDTPPHFSFVFELKRKTHLSIAHKIVRWVFLKLIGLSKTRICLHDCPQRKGPGFGPFRIQ
jgi:hypothetical protein